LKRRATGTPDAEGRVTRAGPGRMRPDEQNGEEFVIRETIFFTIKVSRAIDSKDEAQGGKKTNDKG
jgi:hypothetical protein